MSMENWKLTRTAEVGNKFLYTFTDQSDSNMEHFITVYAKDLNEAYTKLLERIKRQSLRPIGSRKKKDTIDDWMAIEL